MNVTKTSELSNEAKYLQELMGAAPQAGSLRRTPA